MMATVKDVEKAGYIPYPKKVPVPVAERGKIKQPGILKPRPIPA